MRVWLYVLIGHHSKSSMKLSMLEREELLLDFLGVFVAVLGTGGARSESCLCKLTALVSGTVVTVLGTKAGSLGFLKAPMLSDLPLLLLLSGITRSGRPLDFEDEDVLAAKLSGTVEREFDLEDKVGLELEDDPDLEVDFPTKLSGTEVGPDMGDFEDTVCLDLRDDPDSEVDFATKLSGMEVGPENTGDFGVDPVVLEAWLSGTMASEMLLLEPGDLETLALEVSDT